jgi:DNA processing protein
MDASERRFWVALTHAPEFGSRRFLALLERFCRPANLFTESPRSLEAAGASAALIDYLRAPDWARIDRDLGWLDHPQRHCIAFAEDAYPALLREIPAPPPLLFVEGDPGALNVRQIAVVGSRNPSPYGQRVAFRTAAELAACGYAVTSGLALGIDAAGHRGALSAAGKTLAVLGTGLDQTYPRSHQALREEIAATGAVISDFPLGTPPLAANFPRRNRLISGLSRGTLVVEAALRSGSLITARLAVEQGRDVFAIPGSIDNPLARGCHELLRQGAKLVENVSDILDELGGFIAANPLAAQPGGSPAEFDAASRELLKYVACEPTSVDTLVAATGFSAEQVASLLVMLELQGYVASSAGGHYCRII